MRISLCPPVIVGTVAVVGATTYAMAPPPLVAPSPSLTNAAVASAAFDSPLVALADTVGLALNFTLNPTYSTDPATNWGAASKIGPEWNALFPLVHDPVQGFLPHITAVGVIPNFVQVPFPIAVQVTKNWLDYAQLIVQPAGLTTIANDFAAKMSTVVESVTRLTPQWIANLRYHVNILMASVNNAVTGITRAFGRGDLEGAWNAAVSGLVSPDGIPGAVLNLTIGAGIQTDVTNPATNVPSIRNLLQTSGQELASALATTAPRSASVSARATAARRAASAMTAVPKPLSARRALTAHPVSVNRSVATAQSARE